MNRNGYKQKDIAKAIDKDKSVVSRELKRNRDGRSGKYSHDLAQRKYKKRQKEKPKKIRFTKEVQQNVKALLKIELELKNVRALSMKGVGLEI